MLNLRDLDFNCQTARQKGIDIFECYLVAVARAEVAAEVAVVVVVMLSVASTSSSSSRSRRRNGSSHPAAGGVFVIPYTLNPKPLKPKPWNPALNHKSLNP